MKQTKQTKILFILVDGIADLGLNERGLRTTLQLIKKPYLDALAETGINGVMDPVEPGLACGSDTAHMSIFGYNPFTLYRGRGAFESMGSGIPMDFNEIAFKCNFAHMNPESRLVILRRVDRDFDKWGLPLVELLDGMVLSVFEKDDTKITAKHATEHRIGLKVTNQYVSDQITGTDPLKDNLPLQTVRSKQPDDQNSVKTAIIINTLSEHIHQVLSQHPINKQREIDNLPTANIVLLRGCGSRLKVNDFQEMQKLNGFMIAPTAIINGIGQTIGLEILEVSGATGDYHTNLNSKGAAALKHFRETTKDFGFLHIKAVDDAGHDKSFDLKTKFLVQIDEMLGNIVTSHHEQKDEFELIIVLTGDHTTPISVGDHTFEPVPVSISTVSAMQHKFFKKEVPQQTLLLRDKVKSFDEISCASGVLGRFCGGELQTLIGKFKKVIEKIE